MRQITCHNSKMVWAW